MFAMTSSTRRLLLSIALLFTVSASAFAAPPQPASLFSDHMVLQRDAAVPVWGTAEPASEVTVQLAGQSVTTKAGNDGIWKLSLKPLTASATPAELTVSGDGKTVTIKHGRPSRFLRKARRDPRRPRKTRIIPHDSADGRRPKANLGRDNQ
jgi:hypothetical protein